MSIFIDESAGISDSQWAEITLTHPLFSIPIVSRTQTDYRAMDEEYSDGTTDHICCPRCGFCLTCGDCICDKTFEGEEIERTNSK